MLNTLIDELSNSATPDEQAQLALWAGRKLLQQANFQQAYTLLEKAAQEASTLELKNEVARELLQFYKDASKKSVQSSDDINRNLAEHALNKAAELAPLIALPTLAQYLNRTGKTTDAKSLWEKLIKLAPTETNSYLNLARSYEQSNEVDKAVDTYLQLIEAVPSNKNYLVVAQRLESLAAGGERTGTRRLIKIALQGNSTLDHLKNYLMVECYRNGLAPEFYQGGFDQYTQEILNLQSGLYSFNPDVLICAVHASRFFPQLHEHHLEVAAAEAEIKSGLAEIQNLLDIFTSNSTALVLFHNMVIPQHPDLGLLDLRQPLGQQAAFGEINRQLARLAVTRYKNVYILDEEAVQARGGKQRATDPRMWFTARLSWSENLLPLLVKEYLRYLIPFKGLSRKCIVIDLDNTLWGGVIGEDGLSGIQLGADAPGNAYLAFQKELLKLWERGILLAISSKNNLSDVEAVFNQHPSMLLKMSHFAAQHINWEPKEQNLREIAKELNIGLDSLVFLDDNPVERARVRAELPQVLTPELATDPAYYRQALLELGVFDSLALTVEDLNRNKMYSEQQARRSLEDSFKEGSNLEDYLVALEMRVAIEEVSPLNIARIAQLTNKTNQFNLTTRRYSEAEILELKQQGSTILGVRLSDRFGDNGLTGVAIIKPTLSRGPTWWEIDTLLLSCRVMGRGVETALLSYIADKAREENVEVIEGWYLPTPKNSPSKDCYSRNGFLMKEQRPDGAELWELIPAETKLTQPSWLTLDLPVHNVI